MDFLTYQGSAIQCSEFQDQHQNFPHSLKRQRLNIFCVFVSHSFSEILLVELEDNPKQASDWLDCFGGYIEMFGDIMQPG